MLGLNQIKICSFRESIIGKNKTQWGKELTQAVDLLEFIEDNCLTQWVTEETRKNNILDLLFTNSMTIRETEVIKNSMEFSDHNTVISTFLTAMKDDKGEDPINYHKSNLPNRGTGRRGLEASQ